MSTITREFTKEQLITRINQVTAINKYRISRDPDADGLAMDNELLAVALASLEAEPVAFIGQRMLEELTDGARSCGRVWPEVTDKLSDENRIPLYTSPPAPVSVPDDVSGPLAHAYKELTPTFMRNHIDVFERYGIYPDGSAGIQAMRIALDGMNRRAAMLQGADSNSPVIPDGYALVPVEPTHEMLEAGDEQFGTYDVYRRMITAAPQQEVK
ncbi:hypothetical protein Q9Y60_001964 [Escherichia coli]|nr:hypothetical protein [Escherichia coli]